VRRWLVVLLALLVAAGAAYLLLSTTGPVTQQAPDHTQIDSESRAKLREVLREEAGD
jgi:archaellin